VSIRYREKNDLLLAFYILTFGLFVMCYKLISDGTKYLYFVKHFGTPLYLMLFVIPYVSLYDAILLYILTLVSPFITVANFRYQLIDDAISLHAFYH
jgi:hypothetical protein